MEDKKMDADGMDKNVVKETVEKDTIGKFKYCEYCVKTPEKCPSCAYWRQECLPCCAHIYWWHMVPESVIEKIRQAHKKD
jgi:hypothetical protein